MINEAITKSIDYLKKNQEKDGSFKSYSSYSSGFRKAEKHGSPFYTSLILSCLNNLRTEPNVIALKEKAASHILSQKSKNWSFNYWVKGSDESKTMPYPDDLDDTFCALSSLFQHDPKLVGGDALAKAVELLTFLEKRQGGPYRTWIVPDSAKPIWKDVDVAVNSNIAYFLSLVEVELPNINKLIEKNIRNKELVSPYYVGSIPVIYFVSRFYKGRMVGELRDLLLSFQTSRDWWGNSLQTALAVSALIDVGGSKYVSEKTINKLISTQKDGTWEACPFVIESKKSDKVMYAGSKCLTTAFCLEALAKYREVTVSILPTSPYQTTHAKRLQQNIINNVQKRFTEVPTDIGGLAQSMIKEISKMDEKNSITLLPFIFRGALGKGGEKISNRVIISMGEANLYGWIAYTIYDDFLDGEGKPQMLSVANIALRQMTGIFDEFSQKNKGFDEVFRILTDRIDASNTFEVTNCRNRNHPPVYRDLNVIADKSIGIALTPIALLFSLGYANHSQEVKSLISLFTHYLIARQLNDDAHDWEADIKVGHISPVVAMIIKRSKKESGRSLQEVFWYDVILDVCGIISQQIVDARLLLGKISCISNPVVFEGLFVPLENAVKKTLEERQKTLEFLASYEPLDK